MSKAANLLTPTNFEKGFLIDDSWMASVTREPESGGYSVYILDHQQGETLAWREFASLPEALGWVNAMPRPWKYEATSGCGDGGCSGEKCGPSKCKKEACGIYVPPSSP